MQLFYFNEAFNIFFKSHSTYLGIIPENFQIQRKDTEIIFSTGGL
jgi:hypothetical protein